MLPQEFKPPIISEGKNGILTVKEGRTNSEEKVSCSTGIWKQEKLGFTVGRENVFVQLIAPELLDWFMSFTNTQVDSIF